MRQTLLFYNLNSIFMKKIYLFAALAAMLAACSENDLTQSSQTQENNEQAVLFGAYVNRGTTRAGQQGTMTTAVLQTSTSDAAVSNGFGVFGYYTNDELYSQNSKPEFFYNQKVYYSGGWTYSPIKYWPNEFGATAESQAEDKLTFFAYAPYVPVNINTGIAQQTASPADDLETGIISLTRNTALGDPYVKYYASFDPEKCVDLCFGVAKEDFTSSVDGTLNDVKAGTPYVDVKKPKLTDRIFFDFKHALAQLNVQIDADVDEMSHGGKSMTANTKIYVREVTFEGFADKGMLNLYSEAKTADYTPKWVDLSGINEIKSGKVTIYDGRRDGREGQVNADAPNEKPQNLNPTIISDKGNNTDGVPSTALCNLFAGDTKDASILVIPTEEQLSVTIVYDVETADDNLATFLSDGTTHGSTVENKITKAITLNGNPLQLKAGKSYVVNLHLGMTSVKFDASVTDWKAVTPASDVDLPVNGLSAGSSMHTSLMASETEGSFTITGLTNGNNLTVDVVPADLFDGTTPYSPNPPTISDGKTSIDFTLAGANNTVLNKEGKITVTEKDASNNLVSVTTINITQAAAALGLAVTDISGTGNKEISLGFVTGLTSPWGSVIADGNHVKVSKDGAALTYGSGEGKYTYDTSGKIVLGTSPTENEVYTITIQAGDAEAESFTAHIGSIVFVPATDVVIGEGRTFTRTATVTGTGTVEYSNGGSSYDATATINSNTGEVTGVAYNASPVTITATVTNDDENGWFYLTKEATYNVIVKTIGTISFANVVVNELGSTATITTQTVTNSASGTPAEVGSIAYTSSNEEVASVIPGTGVVTINGAGTAIITATATDGSKFTYPNNKVSYTLNVTKANAAISFDVISVTEPKAVGGTYTKEVTNTVSGTEEAIGTITYTSSDESIATVAAGGVVTKKANGTVTITAKATDGKKYKYIVNEASYKLTFTEP